MKPEDTIIWVLDDIADRMCKEYCKWPEIYETGKTKEERDSQMILLMNEKCENCPLRKIGFIPEYTQ